MSTYVYVVCLLHLSYACSVYLLSCLMSSVLFRKIDVKINKIIFYYFRNEIEGKGKENFHN